MERFFEKPQTNYKPIFEIVETMCVNLNDIKDGQEIDGIILNYKVIEKMKNYTVLEIESFYLAPQKRVY